MSAARFRTLYPVTCAVSVALLAIAGLRWHSCRGAADQAARELAECEALGAEIVRLRVQPKSVSLEKRSNQQLTSFIAQAAQRAEIPESSVQRVSPQQERRLGKSPHVQQPTQLEIRHATLGQLARFVTELSSLDGGLKPTSIRLAAPRDAPPDATTECWACELVLTYLVFSPE
jgi:hypothetical protein